MAKDGIQIEFKPVLQYNASTPSLSHSKFSFSSPDLRKSFLSSSSSAFFKTQSQADFGDIKSPNAPKKNLQKEVLMSPLRPSAFSVEGEKDESYAVGANYITTVCHPSWHIH
jgi:hypothetical protein